MISVELRIVAPDQASIDQAVATVKRHFGMRVQLGRVRKRHDGSMAVYGTLRLDDDSVVTTLEKIAERQQL